MQNILTWSVIIIGLLILILVGYRCKAYYMQPLSSSLSIKSDADVPALLKAAFATEGKSSQPRTEHFGQGRHSYTNRLIHEDSPYLLQHAHNPVDWYAWGPEAFAKAKKEDKPIFLSIGYSTCHWCHVMEKESFENLAIAKLLNEYFVPIKVDRERRPDVDAIYMTAVQLISGGGGWPMSSFLTPEGKTFFGGTYYPPEQFEQLLQQIHSLWLTNQPKLIEQANQISQAVTESLSTHMQAQKIEASAITNAVDEVMSRYDKLHGGFSGAPKFPNEPYLYLLQKYVERTGNRSVMDALENTLDSMARGGIYDQICGGFHRYSTDGIWLVPHFEKMLYNQANLSITYLKAWRLTADPEFARIVRQTLDYVLREMTAKDGGFYSATDADSEGEEGLYFLWTPQQIRNVLNPSDAQLAVDIYDVTKNGNFEGQNILHLPKSFAEYAIDNDLNPDELRNRISHINQQLWQERQKRIAPLRDDKIITSWNGMMITAFAQAGDVLDEPRYLNAATKAAEFIWNHNRSKNGELQRVNLNGKASVDARQEDYAYLAESFLTLFDVTGEQRWLQHAIEITDAMIVRFWDKQNGGFFMGDEESATVGMGRAKDSYDGAIPSGNSVAFHVLQMLSRRTDNLDYDKYAEQMLSTFSVMIERNPAAFAYMLSSADDFFHGEIGAHQFAARGAVTVDALIDGTKLTLNISIKPGWHINSHQPLQDYLIATDLVLSKTAEDWHLEQVQYPPDKVTSLGFQEEQLAVYEGNIKLTATLKKTSKDIPLNKMAPIELHLQACNNKSCLPPETLLLMPLER